MTQQLYGDTPFKRHLSFFDQRGEGVLRPYTTLCGALSLGLSFPAACLYTVRLHWRFGNLGLFGLGGVDVNAIPARKERTQLQHVVLGRPVPGIRPSQYSPDTHRYSRVQLTKFIARARLFEKLRVRGFWMMAADDDGYVSRADLESFQKGELLPVLAERRRVGREQKIPFSRGGPLSVSGHSWFVDKLFGVKVYQEPDKEQ